MGRRCSACRRRPAGDRFVATRFRDMLREGMTALARSSLGDYKLIGDLSELEPHGQFSRWVDEHDILVYRHEGEIKAISNVCRHFGGPVGFHKMRDGRFT